MRGQGVQVDASGLFRSLLRPLPSKPIAFRFKGLERTPLTVVAITAASALEANDVASLYSEWQRASVQSAEVVARALRAGDGRVFPTHEDVNALPESELLALSADVRAALAEICPLYHLLDGASWQALHTRLCEGAKHVENFTAREALGRCYDVDGSSGRIVDRPDRYWGVPLADLLDGHWMVFRAARAVFEERQKKA